MGTSWGTVFSGAFAKFFQEKTAAKMQKMFFFYF